VGKELEPIIDRFERYSDDETQLPNSRERMPRKGRTSETLGEFQIIEENAGKYLGTVIKNFDERILEPMGEDFYNHNMMEPGEDNSQGSFECRPLGFSTYQAKIVKVANLRKLLALGALDEAIMKELKVNAIVRGIAKGLESNADQYVKSDEEKVEEAEAQTEQIEEQQVQEIELQDEIQDDDMEREVAKEGAVSDIEEEEKKKDFVREVAMEELKHENALELEKIKAKKVTNIQNGKKKVAAKKPAKKKASK
jgi:hypothetical protein